LAGTNRGNFKFFPNDQRNNSTGKISIELAILSSGHTEFVKELLNYGKKDCPKILITDDDVRKLPIGIKRQGKTVKVFI